MLIFLEIFMTSLKFYKCIVGHVITYTVGNLQHSHIFAFVFAVLTMDIMSQGTNLN